MFTIIKFIGFLKVGVLKTIITMREFPTSETTNIKPEATVCTSFSTTGFIRLYKLQELDPFAVMFMFAAVALKASSRNTEVIVKTTAVQTKLVYAYKTVKASIYLHCSRNIGPIHKYVSGINNINHNKQKQPPFLLAFQITQFVEPEFSSPSSRVQN